MSRRSSCDFRLRQSPARAVGFRRSVENEAPKLRSGADCRCGTLAGGLLECREMTTRARLSRRTSTTCAQGWVVGSLVFHLLAAWSPAHLVHHEPAGTAFLPPGPQMQVQTTAGGVSGQGNLRFRVLHTGSHLPAEAVAVLESAHGGFAVDRRPGRGETYFALPGAGIVQISSDLKSTRLLDTDQVMREVNLHNTTLWFDAAGTPFLTFPAEAAGKVFTTSLAGKLLHTLAAPRPGDDFDLQAVNDYFFVRGKFTPTDVEYLAGLFYVTTGYSSLDYVLTARVLSTDPVSAVWNDLAFGGKGDGLGEFGNGHGVTVEPDGRRIDVADRPYAEIDRFTRYGHYRSTWKMPMGSYPCDIDFSGELAVVGCLHGPDRSQGAPIYLLDQGRVVSTVRVKDELGLEKFQHIHNAVLRNLQGRYYLIVQAWNPGDFAILEQVR